MLTKKCLRASDIIQILNSVYVCFITIKLRNLRLGALKPDLKIINKYAKKLEKKEAI